MGLGSQQYPKPGEREEFERVKAIRNQRRSNEIENEVDARHFKATCIRLKREISELNETIKDKNKVRDAHYKVIEALWKLAPIAECKYEHGIDSCDSDLWGAYRDSETLEQFTEKILEAKE